jgi:hypothetical protein
LAELQKSLNERAPDSTDLDNRRQFQKMERAV